MTEGPQGASPACPVCSREMVFCDPSHEKSYWACPVDHEPPGIVQRGDEIGYAFALACIRVYGKFEQSLEPFNEVETPRDAVGLISDIALDRLESNYQFKQMRQRKGHDDLGVAAAANDESQSGLGRWSA